VQDCLSSGLCPDSGAPVLVVAAGQGALFILRHPALVWVISAVRLGLPWRRARSDGALWSCRKWPNAGPDNQSAIARTRLFEEIIQKSGELEIASQHKPEPSLTEATSSELPLATIPNP